MSSSIVWLRTLIFLFILTSSLFLVANLSRTKALKDARSEMLSAYEDGKAIAEAACSLRISRLEEEKNRLESFWRVEKSILERKIESLQAKIKNSKPLFQRIAEEVANSHEYSPDYNCDDFTRELVRRLREAGYEAERVEGYALWCQDGNSRCRHAWTKLTVYIESTTGEILSPEKYEEMYD